jgi:hypothetical protein
MSDAVEDLPPIQEVWVTKAGLRQRVYRGRVQAEVDWKVAYHAGNQVEVIVPRPQK